jgi:hypothetical protein
MADEADNLKNDENFKELADGLLKLLEIGQGTIKLVNDHMFPPLQSHVNYILEHKIKSVYDIEHTLDGLLDCMMWGSGKDEFYRLNNYYATIHKKFSEDYWSIYCDMFSEK